MTDKKNVHDLLPKRVEMTRRNVTADIEYDPLTKAYRWRVVATVKPLVFEGEFKTEKQARDEVDKYMKAWVE